MRKEQHRLVSESMNFETILLFQNNAHVDEIVAVMLYICLPVQKSDEREAIAIIRHSQHYWSTKKTWKWKVQKRETLCCRREG